ncbi:UDP-N-acetylglucosamine 2-epimerase (non-hydrolyzing) [Exilibacterium tricleocarpae]|uniref:UDP-N-acetylglucosamine 2-epimerase (Non-hydrolyzing) n=1 Tax=Exilibacterium tricleocarpae TaxID=2591008 RepID=A0A545U450_9GAMM|nr:UDP-N-acetylglucosamine 2-epimerase (non-hydrolyzing) [Exilibacterium tricleocarpae]TQV84226.1 UDP-N-acetylglucosamine 2-epimerase (non-hydrolyzing) [Exilibacterium tricleocarpae]
MKLITILGARPQFIKAATVSKAFVNFANEQNIYIDEIIVHTGQHYDGNMSDIFFKELGIPNPKYFLSVGSGTHGQQTAAMLIKIEEVLQKEKPQCVLTYGDTNSTLAGALAASKMNIPLVHIESGLRSFNRNMPEEINRVITDHVSSLLLCPTKTATVNLEKEGIKDGVREVGDVMQDAVLEAAKGFDNSEVLVKHNLCFEEYFLLTLHRAENTKNGENITSILNELAEIDTKVLWPIHPRAQSVIQSTNVNVPSSVIVTSPLGYGETITLLKNSKALITDSGGMQKEAYWLGRPCVTLREETEWVETVDMGWNQLVGANPVMIREALCNINVPAERPDALGKCGASRRCVKEIVKFIFSL